jgi:hypothetical protein
MIKKLFHPIIVARVAPDTVFLLQSVSIKFFVETFQPDIDVALVLGQTTVCSLVWVYPSLLTCDFVANHSGNTSMYFSLPDYPRYSSRLFAKCALFSNSSGPWPHFLHKHFGEIGVSRSVEILASDFLQFKSVYFSRLFICNLYVYDRVSDMRNKMIAPKPDFKYNI